MPTLKGWCPNGHPIDTFISSDDIRREGEEGVIAVTGIADVTCPQCGLLIDALADSNTHEEAGQ